MAYAESTIGGTYGGSFRVWVNSIRVYDGSPAENFEQWRVEGGIDRRSPTGNRIYSNGASYNTQLGMNGMGVSGGFSYDYNTNVERKNAWGSGTTTVYRYGDGSGFGFTSRTDVNLNNSPYLTSGWVQSSDGLITRYRHSAATNAVGDDDDEYVNPWIEFSNPAGAAIDVYIEFPYLGVGNIAHRYNVGSRYTWTLSSSEQDQIRAAMTNVNSAIIRYVVHDSLAGDNWTWIDRAIYIINANPTFSNFTFKDTNTTVTAVTGNDQVLVTGKSTLEVRVPVSNKATANKQATMSSYLTTIGAYSQSDPWSNTADVVRNVGVVTTEPGVQNISVRAYDSRTNNTTVTKTTTVIPYVSPAFSSVLNIKYTNNYDTTNGLTVTATGTNGNTIAYISPLTLAGVDKNAVVNASGVKFDISKDTNTAYSGTYTNVATTQDAGTGAINTTLSTLATSILSRVNALTADNTVRWYIKFQITDKLETQYYETYIDIGRPIMRIGYDGKIYYNEVPLYSPFVVSATTNTSISPNIDVLQQYELTALASNLQINAPLGTPANGQRMMLRIKDNGTTRSLTWNAIYRSVGATIPTATTASKTMYVGSIYNSADSKWDVVAVSIEE